MNMERLYFESDLVKIDKQRFILKTIYVFIFILAVIVVVGGIIFRALLPFNTEIEHVIYWIVMGFGVIFAIFSYVYLSIPYARVRDYHKFVNDALNNKKSIVKATILDIRKDDITIRYGVDYYYIDILEWSNSRNDFIKRSILVDNEFRDLKIEKSTIIDIETTGNILTAYEIL